MKGDISHVVSRCGYVEYRDEVLPMDNGGMQSVASVVDEMLQDGMKVIALSGIIFLIKGFWSSYVERWFTAAMIMWMLLAGFDVWYIRKSDRYRKQ